MPESQRHQRPLSDVVHQLLADRLDRAETPEAQAAWIRLATWVRDRVEELLPRYPYPQPQVFDGLWHEIEARPEMVVLTSQSQELRAAFQTLRARIFKGQVRIGHISSITEHVTLGNPGAEHDLGQARELLQSNPEEAKRLAISAYTKTTAAGETISAENADLAWRLGQFFSDLREKDYMFAAYTRAWNIYVGLLPTVEDLDLLITLFARAKILKVIFNDSALLLAILKLCLQKEDSPERLLRMAEDEELRGDDPLKQEAVERALNLALDYDSCLRVGKAAEEKFHFRVIAIAAYRKAADHAREDAEKLFGLFGLLHHLAPQSEATREVEHFLRLILPPLPQLSPAPRLKTLMVPCGQAALLVTAVPVPVAGLEAQKMQIRKSGGHGKWDDFPAGEQMTFRGFLKEGDYELVVLYEDPAGKKRIGETLQVRVVREEDFAPADRVARPLLRSIKPDPRGFLHVKVKIDAEFRPERTKSLKVSADGGTTWHELLYRAEQGEVEISVNPGTRFCLWAIGEIYGEADSEILEIPTVFSPGSQVSIAPAPGQTRVPVDFMIQDRKPSDELWYSLDGGKTWQEFLQPGERIHVEALPPATVLVRCRNDDDPLRNQYSPAIEIAPAPEPPPPAQAVAALKALVAPARPRPSDDVASTDLERAFLDSPPGSHMSREQRVAEDLIDRDDDDWSDLA